MAGNSNFRMLLTVEADRDKETIIDWYETIRPDLGLDWLNEYDRVEAVIASNPYLYEENLLFIRRALLQRFPYTVYYRIDEEEQIIIILGILHQRQDRNEILRRINLIE
jgi:plasmid stabilization system protein ParE